MQSKSETLLTSPLESPVSLLWLWAVDIRDGVEAGLMDSGRKWPPGHSVCDRSLQTRLHCLLYNGVTARARARARAKARARHRTEAQNRAMPRAQGGVKASSHDAGAARSEVAFPASESTSTHSAATSSSR
jgi:hypothetical protein